MYKIILLFLATFSCSHTYASVDIELACKEKEEQKETLLTKMSTSLKEANLAGQCTGYNSYHRIDWEESCTEFIEQKKSLLSMSTSLKEANSAGQCKGAIYKIVERKCGNILQSIDYDYLAEGASSSSSVRKKVSCKGAYDGW